MRFFITLLTNQNFATVENKEVPLVPLVLAWPSDQITKFREPPIFLTAESFNQSNVALFLRVSIRSERDINVICYTDMKITIHHHQLLKHLWQKCAILAELQG